MRRLVEEFLLFNGAERERYYPVLELPILNDESGAFG